MPRTLAGWGTGGRRRTWASGRRRALDPAAAAGPLQGVRPGAQEVGHVAGQPDGGVGEVDHLVTRPPPRCAPSAGSRRVPRSSRAAWRHRTDNPGKRTGTATEHATRPQSDDAEETTACREHRSLQGKVALVTGSSSGIGAATARMLAGRGAAVVVNSADVGRGRAGARGRAPRGQLPPSRHRRRRPGAGAGGGRRGAPRPPRHPRQQRRDDRGHRPPRSRGRHARHVAAHLRRQRHRHVAGDGGRRSPPARRRRRGRSSNVSSLAGHTTRGSSIPYAASKAAVSHMTELLANVVGPEIRVNAVAPGLVDTPWTADWDVVRDVRAGPGAAAALGHARGHRPRDPRAW